MRILNLFAGLGGNRQLWGNCEITAVEMDPKIAAIYRRQFPDDLMVIGDAYQYMIDHAHEYDFIWSSPPCQSHSRMNKATRHKNKRMPDMALYGHMVWLQHYYDGLWVVENVKPYYEPLIKPAATVGRHLFWSNFPILASDVHRPPDFINLCNLKGKKALQDWLGIHFEENIYYGSNHCPAQVLRNCVHPIIGMQVYDSMWDAFNLLARKKKPR